MNINFHYFVVRVLANCVAKKANISKQIQQKIAYYSQFVDDYYSGNSYPKTLNVSKKPPYYDYFESIGKIYKKKESYIFEAAFTGFALIDAPNNNKCLKTILPFHFITKEALCNIDISDGNRTKLRCIAADRDTNLLINKLVQELRTQIKNRDKSKDKTDTSWAAKLGILLHVYADTFAHEDFSGLHGWENVVTCKKYTYISPNNDEITKDFKTINYNFTSVGHAELLHLPDVMAFKYDYQIKENENSGLTKNINRNNKDRYKQCSKKILDILCECFETPYISDSEWNELFEKIFKVSSSIVSGANEITDARKLAEVWKKEFNDIDFEYNVMNSYFGIKVKKVQDIKWDSLREAGYTEEDLYDTNTLNGMEARKYVSASYEVNDEYFAVNEYVYKHLRRVISDEKEVPKKIEVKWITLNLDNTQTQTVTKESNSSFYSKTATGNLTSRQHKGDENGSTICGFSDLVLPQTEFLPQIKRIVLGTPQKITVKESDSNVQCNDGEVIIGRSHIGDENGDTTYTIAKVYIELKESNILCSCRTVNKEQMTCKESSNVLMSKSGKSIVGRQHYGDENKNTTYTFANLQFPVILRQ